MNGELDILFSEDFRRTVDENLDRDPLKIALDKRLPNAALVASQVKYLQRAKSKLPSYFEARCIVPPLAFEQSSSEATAACKAYSGRLAIDLTCGLGVDAFYLSRGFEQVIAVERDKNLATIARENFRRLGAKNIEVVDASAEEFAYLNDDVNRYANRYAPDLIYADPDRRSAGDKKLVRLEDCSPDIVKLLPQIKKIAPRLVVKLSPLFDVDEVFRVFGSAGVCARVVSLAGECKEIVAEVDFSGQTTPSISAITMGSGEVEYTLEEWEAPTQIFEYERYNYLIVPDVALQKARLARRYFSERGVYIASDNGYGFTAEKPENALGRVLEIEAIEPFDPKSLKRRLREQGVKNVEIMRRDFPLSAAEIARQLGVREGGTTQIAFTRAAGKLWQIFLHHPQLGYGNRRE